MNHLGNEISPYLLQHKDNPVDWYPWSAEALSLAEKRDVPIILSIGYSTCHWCHVMAHESFEDEEVAAYMNDHFVSIKVDREERPDIDQIYMEAIQHMGINGGWPLNVFLLPNGRPFHGGTYYPKKHWMTTMRAVTLAFENKRSDLIKSGDSFEKVLNLSEDEKYNFGFYDKNVIYTKYDFQDILNNIERDFDTEQGGMRRVPKFPMPAFWEMLCFLYELNPGDRLKDQIELTLDKMALGGIFDHLAGGWSRYSTDRIWKVPHFEKMLYDNAQLISLYSTASLKIGSSELWNNAVNLTVRWLKTEMTGSGGGLYSALDADSEGEEGKYYVWTAGEIEKVLQLDAPYFIEQYEITESGNWEEGKNILHLNDKLDDEMDMKGLKEKLYNFRKDRIPPGLDNKILTFWNALSVIALKKKVQAIGGNADEVRHLMDFLNDNAGISGAFEGQISHLIGKKQIPAFLDSNAGMILANIAVYDLIFDESYLKKADLLCQYALDGFYDEKEGLFYYSDYHAEKLIARKKEIFDDVIPSSNAMMAEALYFLGRYLGNREYSELAESMFAKMKPLTIDKPQWTAGWIKLGLLLSSKQREVVITGEHYKDWVETLRKHDNKPSTLYFGAKDTSSLAVFEGRFTQNKATIYICENFACKLPVYSLEEAVESLVSGM